MHWKEYRITRTRVATGDVGDGARRVVETLDGRWLIEREGMPSQLERCTYEHALSLALAPRTVAIVRLPWWRRLWRWLSGGAS